MGPHQIGLPILFLGQQIEIITLQLYAPLLNGTDEILIEREINVM